MMTKKNPPKYKPKDMTKKDYLKDKPFISVPVNTRKEVMPTNDDYMFNSQIMNSPDFQEWMQSNESTGNVSDAPKELFNIKNPKAKTDVDDEQITILSRLYFMANRYKMTEFKQLLDEFVVLRISRNRLSRAEFVKAFQSADELNKKAGIFSGMAGMFDRKQ